MYATISSSGNVLAPKNRCYQYFFAVPDISSETSKKITKSSSWLAWTMIHMALHLQERTGDRSAAVEGRLKCGVRRLAANAGCDKKTMRNQIRRLEEIGLIKTFSRPQKMVVDPATGKLVRKGRCPKLEIFLNIGAEHMRPTKKKVGGKSPSIDSQIGSTMPPIIGSTMPPISESKELNTEHPSGNSYGFGISSDEKLAPPNKSISRISSAGRSRPRPTQYPNKRNNSYTEDFRATSWIDDCWLQTKKMLQEEQIKRDLENRKWEEERLAMECHS